MVPNPGQNQSNVQISLDMAMSGHLMVQGKAVVHHLFPSSNLFFFFGGQRERGRRGGGGELAALLAEATGQLASIESQQARLLQSITSRQREAPPRGTQTLLHMACILTPLIFQDSTIFKLVECFQQWAVAQTCHFIKQLILSLLFITVGDSLAYMFCNHSNFDSNVQC